MYKELVALLRKKCDRAPLVMSAADVIEAQSRQIKMWEEVVKAALNYIPCWVSVSDSLPEDGSGVLAYLKFEVGGRYAAANYDRGIWEDCVTDCMYRTEDGIVTHWMPLPEPPEINY